MYIDNHNYHLHQERWHANLLKIERVYLKGTVVCYNDIAIITHEMYLDAFGQMKS